jgi:hypothetical protein
MAYGVVAVGLDATPEPNHRVGVGLPQKSVGSTGLKIVALQKSKGANSNAPSSCGIVRLGHV